MDRQTDRWTDRQSDYYRAPTLGGGALNIMPFLNYITAMLRALLRDAAQIMILYNIKINPRVSYTMKFWNIVANTNTTPLLTHITQNLISKDKTHEA